MEIIQHNNLTQFLAFIPKIKNDIHEWRLINISLTKSADGSIFYIAKKLWEFLKKSEGEIFICNSREILALVKTGVNADMDALKKGIKNSFAEYECVIDIVETTQAGLQKIEIRLRQEKTGDETIASANSAASLIVRAREKRQSNVIMIAEDDMFMRSLIKKGVEAHGSITALEDGSTVVDTYLKILPDILFLDIHLPVRSGIEILSEILTFDRDAYIVMLSSDSAKDNVLNTQKIGARGFIAKPFTKEKLEETLWKCPTIMQKK